MRVVTVMTREVPRSAVVLVIVLAHPGRGAADRARAGLLLRRLVAPLHLLGTVALGFVGTFGAGVALFQGTYPGGVASAEEARPEVGLPGHVGYGDRHGFAATITRPRRWTEVCAVAVNVGDGSDRSLGCRSIPPSVEITSAGLSPDLSVSSAVGGPTETTVAADASVLLLATGHDWHGGVRSVSLTGKSTVTCVDVDGELRELRSPLAATNLYPDTDATAGPATRAVQLGFDVPTLLAECGRLATWRSLRVELRARAESFDGMVATTGLVTIHHLVLKVATFNIRWSALPPVCGDPFQPQPAVPWTRSAWAKPCPDRLRGEPVVWFPTQDANETLRRWGRDLAARAEVVVLTEVGTAAQAHTIAAAAELPHVYTEDSTRYADVAVLSRFPIVAEARHAIPPYRRWSAT
jgi:hypothetical protein